jgi:hypothetical protein
VLEFLNYLWGLGIGLSYRPARLHKPEGIGSLDSILGLLESLNIRALSEINQCLKIIGIYIDTERDTRADIFFKFKGTQA